MSTFSTMPAGSPPDWVISRMPPGYENRLAEIQRLTAELRAMDRFGSLLWELGPPLEDAVLDLFRGMKLEVDLVTDAGTTLQLVKLDRKRRLLLLVADTEGVIQRKHPALNSAFQLLNQLAGSDDRVVLVAAGERLRPPAERPAAVTPEALGLLARLGVNVIDGPTLFALWSLSVQDPTRARAYLDRIHAQDGGMCLPPTA